MEGSLDFRNQTPELACIARGDNSGAYSVRYSSPPCFLSHHFKGHEIFPIFVQLQWVTTLAYQCYGCDGTITFQRVRCKNPVTFDDPIVLRFQKKDSRLAFSVESNSVISTTGSLFLNKVPNG